MVNQMQTNLCAFKIFELVHLPGDSTQLPRKMVATLNNAEFD